MTMSNEPVLICVDWGSSNFRAFLLDGQANMLDVQNSDQGVLKLQPDEFESCLLDRISPWLESGKLPVLMAGMVGSQQGWSETSYVSCPVSLNGLSHHLYWVANTADLDIAIVPGVKGLSISGQPDVMRGEEVQIFGALHLLGQSQEDALICLPGTHSKWAWIESGDNNEPKVVDFSTQMTGELHNVLLTQSILGRLSESPESGVPLNAGAVDKGFSRIQSHGGLLHHLFSARTDVLDGTLDARDVTAYLSGLLIGTEVKDMLAALPDVERIYLVGNDKLCGLYTNAIEKAGFSALTISGEQAACMGMLAIAEQSNLLKKS